MQGKQTNSKILLPLIAVHVLFFVLACVYQRIYMGDSWEYVYMALNIKEQGLWYSGNAALPITEEYMTLRPPGYSLFLLLVYFFTVNNWVVLALQNIISFANILLLRNSLLRLGYDPKYDRLFFVAVLLYPAQFIHTNTIAPDILLQSTVLIYFHEWLRLHQTKNANHALYMSLALIAGLFIKPVLYPFALVHILLLIWTTWGQGRVVRIVALSLLPVLCIVGCNYINLQRTGKFHFSSTQSFNAVYYYYFYFADKKGIDKAQTFLQAERDQMNAMPVFADRYNYANERGKELLKQNFAPYMAYHLKHSARLLIDPGKGEMDMFFGRLTLGRLYTKQSSGFYATIKEKGISGLGTYLQDNPTMLLVLPVLLFNVLKLAGLFFFVRTKRVARKVKLFVLLLIGYFAVVTGPIANSRYFIPVSLIVAGCAVLGYQYRLQDRKNKPIITS